MRELVDHLAMLKRNWPQLPVESCCPATGGSQPGMQALDDALGGGLGARAGA